ncbi:MAG: hypothetical protein OHK0022_39460 [Roseiflexaceae bacterium]
MRGLDWRRGLVVLVLALAGLLAVVVLPPLLWAYHIQRAGSLIEQGMVWPEPRASDSLPQTRDVGLLAEALAELQAARRWRPDDSYSYRLAGQVALARGDWEQAAAAFEQARLRAPRDPLVAWEAGLAYEQLQRTIERAPYRPIEDRMAAGILLAQPRLVRSLFCTDRGAESCYFGRATYTQPFADDADRRLVQLAGLFLHPPARLVQTIAVPTDTTALQFALGLDPAARPWKSDGATFRVRVEPPGEAEQLRYERLVGPDEARRGWLFGWADLSPWAGRTITLTLESDPGPAGDNTDDWFAWADVGFTSTVAARAVGLNPRDNMRAAWRAAGLTARLLQSRADEATIQGDSEAATRWRRRANLLK